MLNGSMAYIDATLSNTNDTHQLHIDADDMKELMDNAYTIISSTLQKVGKFNITSFHSNVMSLEHFRTLMEMRLQKR